MIAEQLPHGHSLAPPNRKSAILDFVISGPGQLLIVPPLDSLNKDRFVKEHNMTLNDEYLVTDSKGKHFCKVMLVTRKSVCVVNINKLTSRQQLRLFTLFVYNTRRYGIKDVSL